MAENQTQTSSPQTTQPVAAQPIVSLNAPVAQKVFTPLPVEPVAVQKPAPVVVSAEAPNVTPPLENSAKIAVAAGLTAAQIEKQSAQKTFPVGVPVAPQFSPPPKNVPPPQKSTTGLPDFFTKLFAKFASKPAGSPISATQKAPQNSVASQPDPLAKIFAKLAAKPAVPKAPPPPAPNEQKLIEDKTATQQFINHNQIGTAEIVNKLFGKDKKAPDDAAKQFADAEKIYREGLASVRDLISPSSFEVHYDHLNLSGVLVRSFFVYAYPRFLDTNWMSSLVNLDATVDIAQFIYPIASDEIMRTLKKKVAQIQSSITMSVEKGNVRDPVLETALEDAESLRTDLQRGQEKFFQFGMYFTVYAENLKKLEATTKIIESQLGGRLILTKRADIQGEHAFNSTLPLGLDELEVQRNMNTSPLSTTFPFISSSLATDEGILYGLNRHNNSLIIFDRFKLPNANSTVFATSGAGKSYAVKLEILRQVMLGADVIVVDPENEYKALTETVGGTYLNVSLNSNQRINPFDLPAPFEGDDVKPGDLLRENIITLTGLLKIMLGAMTPSEAALIDKALIDTYAIRGITMAVEDPSKMPMPTMDDLHAVLQSTEGAKSLAQRLQKFTTGTFGGIFNRETNVNLGTGLIVFCIRDLEDELRPIAMFILLNFIWSRVRSELKKRILVVDEAWTLMQHEDAARFLYGLVKRARKYYLGVITITQDVEDFLESKYGRPIVTNASMQILLKQSPSAIDALKKTFNLTDGEKYMLLNSGVGQGLFFADDKHVAIQIIASYSENKIVTTNPEELLSQREEGFE